MERTMNENFGNLVLILRLIRTFSRLSFLISPQRFYNNALHFLYAYYLSLLEILISFMHYSRRQSCFFAKVMPIIYGTSHYDD